MCAYLIQITLVSCDAHPSNVANYSKMFCVIVIMLRGWFQALLIRYNHNTMVEIYPCLLKVLHWNSLVYLPKADINSTTLSLQRHALFQYFYLIIENKMLPLLLHTASVLLH